MSAAKVPLKPHYPNGRPKPAVAVSSTETRLSMDPQTAYAIGVVSQTALQFGADAVKEVLGPTWERLGERLRDRVLSSDHPQTKVIVEQAQRRLGSKASEPGAVPLTVAARILSQGAWRDDAASAAYYGGLLASARTASGRDDSVTPHVSLIERLSSFQVKSHYLLYRLAQRPSTLGPPDSGAGWEMIQFELPVESFIDSMQFDDDERQRIQALLEHCLFGLNREGLLGEHGYSGGSDNRLAYAISHAGVQLFMAAHGWASRPMLDFFRPECLVDDQPELGLVAPAVGGRTY